MSRFFDHDFVTIDQVAGSFVEWIARYAEIEIIPIS
jgi:hypothetical protein